MSLPIYVYIFNRLRFMTDTRIRTTLRLPKDLHERFDEGSRNADIVKRLTKSFEDEWRQDSMTAYELLKHIDIPDTVRFNSSNNAHQDISALCELTTGLKLKNLVLATSKTRKLIAIMQTEEICIIADNLNFELNSQARAEDLMRLTHCLDFNGLIENTYIVARPVGTDESNTPVKAVTNIGKLPCETGLPALRSLFRLMNPGIEVDI